MAQSNFKHIDREIAARTATENFEDAQEVLKLAAEVREMGLIEIFKEIKLVDR